LTHNLQPFKPIIYNLSSEKPVSKFAFQIHNLQRYGAALFAMPTRDGAPAMRGQSLAPPVGLGSALFTTFIYFAGKTHSVV
jgi:hypothetical protein